MTDTNPVPACLSHLTQRDAAVRAKALEEAAMAADYLGKPDSMAIRAELVAALRGLEAVIWDFNPTHPTQSQRMTGRKALIAARAALARAEATPGAST